MLVRHVERLMRASTLNQVVVATTTRPVDDAIALVCAAQGWACFRGSEDDVLDRYYQAACAYHADVVVRVTSDCPMIDPEVVDMVVTALTPEIEYASNVLGTRTFPRGLDVEVIRFATLERMWHEDNNPEWREHVTEYLFHYPELFATRTVTWSEDRSDERWTVDTPEDLALVRTIFEHFGHDHFTWRDIIAAQAAHPSWKSINRNIVQKVVP